MFFVRQHGVFQLAAAASVRGKGLRGRGLLQLRLYRFCLGFHKHSRALSFEGELLAEEISGRHFSRWGVASADAFPFLEHFVYT